jgi:uncharacterized protein YecE (DUF72 family)
MLAHYGRLFNTVELNATFYAIPSVQTVRGWARKVPAGFRFSPKVYRQLSHEGRLGQQPDLVHRFVDVIRELGDRLGPCFLQLPPGLGPEHLADLTTFLDLWPEEVELSVELRHPGWFAHGISAFPLLRSRGVGTVITDSAGRRDAVHQSLTTRTALIRFQGNDLHPTDSRRISDWARRLEQWVAAGLERAFFFFHLPNETLSPDLARTFVNEINRRLGLRLTPPRPVQPLLAGW